ncbi:MAG: hypothetical protein ACRDXX_07845, partial [Stackebrandtia sp.]
MTAAPNPPAPGGPGGHHAPNSTGTAEPAASSPRRAISAISRRSAHLLRQTPGRLALALTFILALTAVSGATSATDAGARADLIDEVSGQQGRMSVAAFDMYRALSDADSAATEAFLPGRTSQDARDGDYEDGVGRATSALVTLSAEASTKDQTSLVAELSAALPTYTGLVETARTYHRQQLPLGLAYLNNASALVHQEMLPTIKRLQNSAMDDLRAAKDDAVGFPWLATIAVVLLLALLAYWQMWLTRHTNRFVNVGLAAATLVVL